MRLSETETGDFVSGLYLSDLSKVQKTAGVGQLYLVGAYYHVYD